MTKPVLVSLRPWSSSALVAWWRRILWGSSEVKDGMEKVRVLLLLLLLLLLMVDNICTVDYSLFFECMQCYYTVCFVS